MKPDPSSHDKPVTYQDQAVFKVIPWVRAVRDAMYEETQHMNPTDFVEYVKRRAVDVRKASSSS